MPFTEDERREIHRACTRFLGARPPRPVAERLREMAESEFAQKSSDFYGSGGAVALIETEVAEILGKEAAVFMPTGTMAQQIALRIWCDRAGNSRIAYHPTSHLEIHEQGAYRELHHLSATLLGEANRLFTLNDLVTLEEMPAALLIELPQREIGGQLPTWEELTAITDWARERDVKLHMDGARLWECAPYYGRPYAEISGLFDSVYVSFYKILGGLPGAILAGPADLIDDARVWQRRHGGNLFSLAPNAIAAKIGLDAQLPNIPAYCQKAAELAAALQGLPALTIVPKAPPTNMMHLYFEGNQEALVDALWAVARDSRTFLFGRVAQTPTPNIGKVELSISSSSLQVATSEIRTLLEQVMELAQSDRAS